MKIHEKPKNFDLFLLICFVLFITFQPFLFHGEIEIMELGIHLPGLNAMFKGAVPYRDFFYLRGPLELYVPYFMMIFIEKTVAMLPIFYCLGTIATLLIYVILGKCLYRSRLIFYLMVPVLVARTFPRVGVGFWGGMRYALPIFSLCCLFFYSKRKKAWWLFIAGIFSGLSLLTTIEAGVASVFAILGSFIFMWCFKKDERSSAVKILGFYFGGLVLAVLPLMIYFLKVGALGPMVDSIATVVLNMRNTFVEGSSEAPQDLIGFISALSPTHDHFEYMTPVFCFIFFCVYTVLRIRNNKIDCRHSALIGVFLYAVVLFAAAFRKIQNEHFEMALQPTKILLFFLLEEAYFFLQDFRKKMIQIKSGLSKSRKRFLQTLKIHFIHFLFLGLVMSSLGYSWARFDHRFENYKLVKSKLLGEDASEAYPFAGKQYRMLDLDRSGGMVVPDWQAEELEGVVDYIKENVSPGEVVFTYPELGIINFLADRPFVGKFPIANFSWMKEEWRQSVFDELLKLNPKVIILGNLDGKYGISIWCLRRPLNLHYFKQTTDWILQNYTLKKKYRTISIYQRR